MNEWFPYYLALGMTYEQYWRSDPYLTVYYQKAKKMKFDYDNQMAWINGMYIYDAVSAIVFNTWCRPYCCSYWCCFIYCKKSERQKERRRIKERSRGPGRSVDAKLR